MVTADALVEQLRAPGRSAPARAPRRPARPRSTASARRHAGRSRAPGAVGAAPARRSPDGCRPPRCRSCCSRSARCACWWPRSSSSRSTWSLLGLTGRTLVLLGVHRRCSPRSPSLLTRKALRGAAETFWLVVAGMLTVDLLAAGSAGLARPRRARLARHGALVGVRPAGPRRRRRRVGPPPARGPVVRRRVGGRARRRWCSARPTSGRARTPRSPALALPLLAGSFCLLRRPVPGARRTASAGWAA